MGKLLSLLARDESTCCTPQKYDVFLDFENAQPSDNERETFEDVQRVLKNSESILEEIQFYKGAGKEIREAISAPTDECQRKAYLAVAPLVAKLKRFYEFSLELEGIVPKILGQLCSGNLSPTQHLETQQALVKQLAEILEFVFKFDEHKMKTPAIQNDFSYYRRTLTRTTFPKEDDNERDICVGNELAYRMSLFYANATPMLRVLSEATLEFLKDNEDTPRENITETLGTMAKVCLRMLENPNLLAQFQREETQLFVLRVMVGLVILYDHVHPQGAFIKGSNVDVKGCIKLLKDQPPCKSEGLLNALRYTTKHLNEENTPKNIRNLLAS
ncbi:CYFIP-related Rac1 interactor B [Neodiprion pinetum]|uniref:CYFIP-related Rac1 interactor B n=1 Tax=Neodiprion lecontei TaxID=441921 RepID=A0A6J0B7J6_NEOLC|nr:CYFIP-related Rac1 interactor B [Neodiprion lecontei]XP_046413265.1 CYFIP-related Rac1 interactor B [Neodiprion fabricii]XP_046413266.1 CYFIP-related Rac1 interactor B [Neodiprion fabricii]XP_046413267.1 CYFIP-related Rac1 interactor B [Neodiprion fabricii]XP_046413268.1 CYFIP-related Rac1 interactor B [Neodiprion fabricii]XP_046469611.1 CYFIP-related Rac1 interactor B [Neodiprion pinetum]XP_046469612.1 CYFIP-related Rac1 interactor B [Neodiprion pinetum]XP_046469613.1 CYFIP-related Rac1 